MESAIRLRNGSRMGNAFRVFPLTIFHFARQAGKLHFVLFLLLCSKWYPRTPDRSGAGGESGGGDNSSYICVRLFLWPHQHIWPLAAAAAVTGTTKTMEKMWGDVEFECECKSCVNNEILEPFVFIGGCCCGGRSKLVGWKLTLYFPLKR